jgi:hypothetical protein
VALDYLETACPQRGYSICPQLPLIRAYRDHLTPEQERFESTADFVLWGPPMTAAGGYETVATYAASVSSAAMALLFADSTGPRLAAVSGTLLAAIAANALVTGALSSVHDRYQSRVTCLLTLAAMMLSYRWCRNRFRPALPS